MLADASAAMSKPYSGRRSMTFAGLHGKLMAGLRVYLFANNCDRPFSSDPFVLSVGFSPAMEKRTLGRCTLERAVVLVAWRPPFAILAPSLGCRSHGAVELK
ncbi:unnamed protein product [Schistocephalus solidus]|uniref:Uncharacterized protein n=1 Tax=Schistocephalus solidus TaxID=70667 RepID=A0A183SDW5_SCHSO|nr:unnamed protein product [Schistocephalus solidus]